MTSIYRSRIFSLSLLVLIIDLTGASRASDWEDPLDEMHFQGNTYYGAMLAVAETGFLSRTALEPSETLLAAVTNGGDQIKIFSFNTGTEDLSLEETVSISASGITFPVAYTPSFMELDITGQGREACLVVPVLGDSDDEEPGSISIVRLTERSSGALVVIDNCFDASANDHWSVYYVAELPSLPLEDYAYAISTETVDVSPPPETDDIVLASFNSSTDDFEQEAMFSIPGMYYGHRHGAVGARVWMTKSQHFFYNDEITLCYTTNHNGGIFLWDPENDGSIVSRIAGSQNGGWYYNGDAFGELGDVHRAAILEGGSGTQSRLDNIRVDSRLMFFSNNVMGFIIFDVSNPVAPQFVWQWDGDMRPQEMGIGEEDWDWHGAGDVDDTMISQSDGGGLPAEAFGIGVAIDAGDEEEEIPPTIHVYLADSVEGLLRFDLSEFIDPFGYDLDEGTTDLDFDDFSVDVAEYSVESTPMHAYDLRTYAEDGDTYVFTTWREGRQDIVGDIGLTVHLDEGVIAY